MTADEALRRIHAILDDGEEWDSETIEHVAGVVLAMGYEIRDPNEMQETGNE